MLIDHLSIIVVISAGVGRTGTFICIDGMMDMISRENKIDVFTFAAQMRQQRPEMVQTEVSTFPYSKAEYSITVFC